jgi:hypothetical protein
VHRFRESLCSGCHVADPGVSAPQVPGERPAQERVVVGNQIQGPAGELDGAREVAAKVGQQGLHHGDLACCILPLLVRQGSGLEGHCSVLHDRFGGLELGAQKEGPCPQQAEVRLGTDELSREHLEPSQ